MRQGFESLADEWIGARCESRYVISQQLDDDALTTAGEAVKIVLYL
jgi:hypothetical protein